MTKQERRPEVGADPMMITLIGTGSFLAIIIAASTVAWHIVREVLRDQD